MSQPTNDQLRFDGRVAIVTGAGGQQSLGRAYAHLLGARGAKVVVNDLGLGPDGRGTQRARADVVAQEIVDGGGEAVPDTHSVAESDSAQAMIQTALDAWGRVDIVVNNAGLNWTAKFDELSESDLQTIIDTHFMGGIWVSRAAWPHMKGQQYGRIVNIASGAMFGELYTPVYSAAKAGVYGLTRALAVEGLEEGIRVNAVLPFAWTAAVEESMVDSGFRRALMPNTPEQVAPTIAYLAHKQCAFTGKALVSGAGRVAEMFASTAAGYVNAELTPEAVRDHVDTILDRTDATPVTEADAPTRRAITPKAYVAAQPEKAQAPA